MKHRTFRGSSFGLVTRELPSLLAEPALNTGLTEAHTEPHHQTRPQNSNPHIDLQIPLQDYPSDYV
jgi:hypothetical protein